MDKEKCYIFVRAEGVEIKYKYYYPPNGAEITDILNNGYYDSATVWNINQSSGIPTTVPATEQQHYIKNPLQYVDKIKSETENKIAKEEWAKMQEAKKMKQLGENLKPLPQQNPENKELAPNTQGNEQMPEYLWATHSPSGATGATGGNESYPNPEEASILQYLKDFGNGILEFDAKVREYYGYINPVASSMFPDLQAAKDFTEDYKIILTGTNWDGEEANRWLAGFLAFFPADKFIDGLKTIFKSVKRVSAKYGKLFLDDAKSCWDDLLNWSKQHQLSPAGFSADELSAFLEHQHLRKSGKDPNIYKMDDGNDWIRNLPQNERTEIIEEQTKATKEKFGYLNNENSTKPTEGLDVDGENVFYYNPSSGERHTAKVGDLERQKRDNKITPPKLPEYENPGHHDPKSKGANSYNSSKSVLPDNHQELWEQSIQGDAKTRWTIEKNGKNIVYHRFQDDGSGKWHWNGSTNGKTKAGESRALSDNIIPNEIKKLAKND